MSLLVNAVGSIQVGVEDYLMKDSRRYLSAVRNICAGILLLYKEKLRQLSLSYPHDQEILIKKDIKPSLDSEGNLGFMGNGKKTVDVQEINGRFKTLKINVDWKKFEALNQLRNDIEHYYTTDSPNAVREIIAKSFILIRDFISDYLNKEPHQLLGDVCWNALLDTADVYEAEEADCRQSFDSIEFKHQILREAVEQIRCPFCHSSLIKARVTGEFTILTSLSCGSCSKFFEFGDVMSECLLDCEHLPDTEEGFAYCNDCQYTGCPSVISTGDEWLCLNCLTTHQQIEQCEYCSEFVTGDIENSYMLGCLMCEGQMEHYMNSRAYNWDD